MPRPPTIRRGTRPSESSDPETARQRFAIVREKDLAECEKRNWQDVDYFVMAIVDARDEASAVAQFKARRINPLEVIAHPIANLDAHGQRAVNRADGRRYG